jgi:hypothetical protein
MNHFILVVLCVSLGCLAWVMLAIADWLLGDAHSEKLATRHPPSSANRQSTGRFHVHGV